MKKLKWTLFCIKWLFLNRNWSSTRQKYKALDRAAVARFGEEGTT